MNIKQVAGVAAVSFLLSACGNGGSSGGSGSSDPEVREEGVFDDMVDTLDRAESVQDIGLDRKAEMDEMMEGE